MDFLQNKPIILDMENPKSTQITNQTSSTIISKYHLKIPNYKIIHESHDFELFLHSYLAYFLISLSLTLLKLFANEQTLQNFYGNTKYIQGNSEAPLIIKVKSNQVHLLLSTFVHLAFSILLFTLLWVHEHWHWLSLQINPLHHHLNSQIISNPVTIHKYVN